MKRYITLIALLLWGFTVWGQPAQEVDTTAVANTEVTEQTASDIKTLAPERLWEQANTAYINNDFRSAIQLYEELLSDGLVSSKLYFNLGNAYFKEHQIGEAILNYHRALRLSPGNEDIQYNLQVAEKHTKDSIEAIPEFFVKSWMRNIRHLMSGNAWTLLSLVVLVLMLGSVLFYLLSRRLIWRKVGFYGTVVMLLLLILTTSFAAADRRETIARSSAIIMREAVAIKSSPDPSATDLFILHEGTMVEISNRLDNWCEITIADGKKGWMECAKLETI